MTEGRTERKRNEKMRRREGKYEKGGNERKRVEGTEERGKE